MRAELARHGVESAVIPGPEGDRFNLFATIGPRDRPGYILSGHMDVVPAEGLGHPFRLASDGVRLSGRGTTDMKGFLACVLAMVPEFLAMPLTRPVHIAFSYDEEIGCRGVGHLIERLPSLCARPAGCIVGEPTEMRPVLSHKASRPWSSSSRGGPAIPRTLRSARTRSIRRRSSCSSSATGRPGSRQRGRSTRVQPAACDAPGWGHPGGNAVNIIPDRASIEIEVRSVPVCRRPR